MRKKITLLFLVLSCGLLSLTKLPNELVNNQPLDPSAMMSNPMDQFQDWYEQAKQKEGEQKASIFVLATVNLDCIPSTRSMTAEIVDEKGISFFGNMNSQKMMQLKMKPSAAATFYWDAIQRQVNIIGKAVLVSEKGERIVFNQRAKGSQVSSLISKQGQVISNLNELLQLHKKAAAFYQDKPVPTPINWGGYRLEPEVVEFWQAGAYNMHSRVQYTKKENGQWQIKMLAP